MSEWTYHVNITTEAGSSIASAVTQLSTAQAAAREQFKNFNEIFQGEEFGLHMMEALKNRLDEWEQKKQEKKEKAIDPILAGIQEIKAAIITMMNLKTADIPKVLESFQEVQDLLENTNIRSTLIGLLKVRMDETMDDKEKLTDELLKIFDLKTPTLNKKEENYLSPEGSENIFSDAFHGKYIGEDSEIMKNYVKKISEDFSNEFQKTIFNISKKSGVDIFKNVLGDVTKNENYQKIKTLVKNINDAKKAVNKHEREYQNMGNIRLTDRNKKAYVTKSGELNKTLTEAEVEFEQDASFKFFQVEFSKGLKKLLQKNSLFKGKEGFKKLNIITNEVMSVLKGVIEEKAKLGTEKSPSLAGTFLEILKDTDNMIDIESIMKRIMMTTRLHKDPLKLKQFEKEMQEILTVANEGVSGEGNIIENFTKNLKEIMRKKGYSKSYRESMGRFFDDFLVTQQLDVEDAIKSLFNNIDIITTGADNFIAGKTNTENMLTYIDMMKTLEIDSARVGKGSGLTKDKPDFHKYFEKAINDREERFENLWQEISNGIVEILSEMRVNNNGLSDGIAAIQSNVDGLKKTGYQKNIAGTPKELGYQLGG